MVVCCIDCMIMLLLCIQANEQSIDATVDFLGTFNKTKINIRTDADGFYSTRCPCSKVSKLEISIGIHFTFLNYAYTSGFASTFSFYCGKMMFDKFQSCPDVREQ